MKYLFEKFVGIKLYHLSYQLVHINRTPCQGISFFEVFFIFFEFFEKKDQMAGMAIRWKWLNFLKLSTVLWNNHYFCTLKWFWWKFQSKLSHTCSSNWNYFRKIDIKSFKRAKLGRTARKFLILGDYQSNVYYFVW